MSTQSAMPAGLARERGEVLHRALRSLPTELLAPLLRGTRAHVDSLAPGALFRGKRGCAVGMMLRELGGPRRSPIVSRRCTVHEEAPDLARDHPRLAHLEFIFDRTCEELCERTGMGESEAARTTGMWLAAEVAAEINLRHMESVASEGPPTGGATIDDALFADTVERVLRLRPWMSEAEATRIVESAVGVRRVERMTMPAHWDDSASSAGCAASPPSSPSAA